MKGKWDLNKDESKGLILNLYREDGRTYNSNIKIKFINNNECEIDGDKFVRVIN